MTGPSNGNDTTEGKLRKQMHEDFEKYLAHGKKIRSPREAHVFALAMAHKGITYSRSIEQVIMGLEGALPAYWAQE